MAEALGIYYKDVGVETEIQVLQGGHQVLAALPVARDGEGLVSGLAPLVLPALVALPGLDVD